MGLATTVCALIALCMGACENRGNSGTDWVFEFDLTSNDTAGLDLKHLENDTANVECPPGQVPGHDFNCIPVGIQGCAEIFLGDDNLCHPRMEKCPPGSIPKFDEGCIEVGIPNCADMFLEEDGLCYPYHHKCPPATIPVPDQGCVAVGITECHEMFRGEDGWCHVSSANCPPDTIPNMVEGCIPVGLTTCPDVFKEPEGCSPRAELCEDGTFPVPTQGCLSIDGPDGCGQGNWGNLVHTPETIYVNGGWSGQESNGSQEAPFASIGEALSVASAGSRIAVAPGTYEESITISTDGLELVGVCPSKVRLQLTGDAAKDIPAIVQIEGAKDAKIAGISVGGDTVGVWAAGAGTAVIEDSAVVGATGAGVRVGGAGTSVQLKRCLIQETAPNNSEVQGVGLEILDSAAVSVEMSALVANHHAGILVQGVDSEITLSGTYIGDSKPSDPTAAGYGIAIEAGAYAHLHDCVVTANVKTGVEVSGQGSNAILENSMIAHTQAPPVLETSEYCAGASVSAGASLELHACQVTQNAERGAAAFGAASLLSASPTLIERALLVSTGIGFAIGVNLYDGAGATLTENTIRNNEGKGIVAVHDGTWLEATGNLVESTQVVDESGALGWGMNFQGGPEVWLESNTLADNRGLGLFAAGDGTHLVSHNNMYMSTSPDEAFWETGVGIALTSGATIDSVSDVVLSNCVAGVFLRDPGTYAKMELSAICDTKNVLAVEDNLAIGFWVGDGASAHLTDVALARNGIAGLHVTGENSTVEASGLVIEGETPSTKLHGMPMRGIGVQMGASATIDKSAVLGHGGMGVGLADLYTNFELRHSIIANSHPTYRGGHDGTGLYNWHGAQAHLYRTAIVANENSGVAAYSQITNIDLVESLIADTKSKEVDGSGGIGVIVGWYGSAALTGNAIVNNKYAGVATFPYSVGFVPPPEAELIPNSHFVATKNLVQGTLPRDWDLELGVGFMAYGGTAMTLHSNAVVLNHSVGVLSIDRDTYVLASHNLIEDTQPGAGVASRGHGFQAYDGTFAILENNALIGNHEIGVWAGNPETILSSTNDLIRHTAPNAWGGWGAGYMCEMGARLTVNKSVAVDNATAAAFVLAASASFNKTRMGNTWKGKAYSEGKIIDDVADGLLAVDYSEVEIAGSVVHGCPRAGLLFHQSSGSVSDTILHNNGFGIVLQGSPSPSLEESITYFDNHMKDLVTDGQLPVSDEPTEPPPTPNVESGPNQP